MLMMSMVGRDGDLMGTAASGEVVAGALAWASQEKIPWVHPMVVLGPYQRPPQKASGPEATGDRHGSS